MNKEYEKPNFDVTEYEVQDVITASGLITDQDPDGGGEWWG